MKYRGNSKIKHEHGIIPGLREFLEDELEPMYETRTIIPGRITKKKGTSPGFRVRFQYPTSSGAKILAYNSGAVQEVFVVTSDPESLKRKLEQSGKKPSPPKPKKTEKAPRSSMRDLEQATDEFTEEIGTPETAFEPSEFQREALDCIPEGDVMVIAPTGSGKTWIAEQAMAKLLAEGKQCWYTTPLKALSNQKYDNFQRLFGEENVGILTGEREENSQAPLIVATTEVFRNALYTGSRQPWLAVLDEAHYLGDEDRGTTWEEIIILASPETHLLLLSATISNAEEIAEWMESVRGHKPYLVTENERPVPLRHGFITGKYILPLEPELIDQQKPKKGRSRFRPERMIEMLEERNLLPAIVFLPTRKDCDRAARGFQGSPEAETSSRIGVLNEIGKDNPHLWKNPLINSLIDSGVASHHAGHLTEWKIAVERLLALGKLRAVFATTTLAAGLDVPARSVVLPTLLTRDAVGTRPLNSLEFHQMTGRAGRRGKDNVGFVILDMSHPRDLLTALNLKDAAPDPIKSAFSINYYQILNLLSRFDIEETTQILEKSLLLFQQTSRKRAKKTRAKLWDEMNKRIEVLQNFGYLDSNLSPTELGEWASLIRHEYSLVFSEAIRRELYPSLSPSEFAGWAAAMSPSRAPDYSISRLNLKPLLKVINELQRTEKRKGIPPVQSSSEEAVKKATAVKAWAEGAEWRKTILEAGIEEGDFQRLVLQTSEVLRELSRLPLPVASLASKARDMILRPPFELG
ncbi:MAG: DEAD/DEAH box helicase [Dehalococcoidia bacterium]